jgi:hypothetical protein
MATKKQSRKKPGKTAPAPDARKPKATAKKPAPQPALAHSGAATEAREPAAAKATATPALFAVTSAGLGTLRADIDTSARRSDTRKRGTSAAKEDEASLSDALDRLEAGYSRLLR